LDTLFFFVTLRVSLWLKKYLARKTQASWEHKINDASIITRENIARCCVACNSSKKAKKLSDWINSNYCKKKGINKNTVADVIKKALNKNL
jgi:hypothetical protein